jgi:hypothetical protein
MISAQQNIECLTKVGMLKYFPTKEGVVAEVGRLLIELCQSDQEARQLTAAVCTKLSEWPGPAKVREFYQSEVVEVRQAAERERVYHERLAENQKQRDQHETECPGYELCADDKQKTIIVHYCRKFWDVPLKPSPPDGSMYHEYRTPGSFCCRKGDALRTDDPEFCERRLAEELSQRPGWLSETEYWSRHAASLKQAVKLRPSRSPSPAWMADSRISE